MIKAFLRKTCFHGFRLMCVIAIHIFYRMRVIGKENVPKDGPALILSNHQSFLDPLLCQSTVKRSFHFVARQSLFDNPVFGAIIRSFYAVPIKRGQADLSSMKRIIAELKQGYPMCLFPEATRTADGKIADIKPGFGLLSRRSGAVVVPMIIDGAFEMWPKDRKFPKIGGRIVVCYGKPITVEQVKELPSKEFAGFVTTKLRDLQNKCRVELGKEPFDYPEVTVDDIDKGDTE